MKDCKLHIVHVFFPLVLFMLCNPSGIFARELDVSPSSTADTRRTCALQPGHAGDAHPHEQVANGTGNRSAHAMADGYGIEVMDHHVMKDKKGRSPGISLSIDSRKDC